jgi:hypothetical protein
LALGVLVITATLYFLYQEDKLYSQYDNHKQLAVITLHKKSESIEILLNTKQMDDALSNLPFQGIREASLVSITSETIDFEMENDTFFKYTCERAFVNKSFFNIFSSKIKSGSLSDWEKDGVIITNRFSKKIYKGENPIGKSVLLNNKYYKIVGIMEAYSSPGIIAADIYMPIPDKQMGRCNKHLFV